MKLQIKNKSGESAGEIDVRPDVFAVPEKMSLVHQVATAHLANKRQGTAKTKTRSEVSGGGAKPRPQKHTGGSRQGSIRSPLWVGGGRAFGPTPRSYRQSTPKKMRRIAILSALSSKYRDGNLVILNDLDIDSGKTKEMASVLGSLNITKSVLVVTDVPNENVINASRNLNKVKTLPAHVINTLDLVNKSTVVMTVEAVRKIEDLWGGVYKKDTLEATAKSETTAKPKAAAKPKATAKPKPVEQIGLSSRNLNLLLSAGLKTVDDVMGKSKKDLLEIKGFGEKSYVELCDKLKDSGIKSPENIFETEG